MENNIVNKKAINKTIALIKKASANKIRMAYWFSDGKGTEISKNKFNPHKCKTTACIAGWVMSANPTAYTEVKKRVGSYYPDEQTSIILNISRLKCQKLVYNTILDDLTPAKRKKAVIKVLENLRDTGQVKWEY